MRITRLEICRFEAANETTNHWAKLIWLKILMRSENVYWTLLIVRTSILSIESKPIRPTRVLETVKLRSVLHYLALLILRPIAVNIVVWIYVMEGCQWTKRSIYHPLLISRMRHVSTVSTRSILSHWKLNILKFWSIHTLALLCVFHRRWERTTSHPVMAAGAENLLKISGFLSRAIFDVCALRFHWLNRYQSLNNNFHEHHLWFLS